MGVRRDDAGFTWEFFAVATSSDTGSSCMYEKTLSEFNERIAETCCAACLGATGDRSFSSGLAWRSRREAGSSSVSWN
jgi:hypothetical protein